MDEVARRERAGGGMASIMARRAPGAQAGRNGQRWHGAQAGVWRHAPARVARQRLIGNRS